MKELSNEDKAKRYDEAIEIAKEINNEKCAQPFNVMTRVFPELKESDDEKIRKKICKLLWDNAPYEEAQEYIAWLEKQNEQKPVVEMKTPEESLGIDSETYSKIVDECIYGEQKPEGKTALEAAKEEKVDNANKVEPKDYSSIDPHFFKTTDNVESKFHEGDWITNGDYTWKIVEVKPLDYILQSQDGNIIVDTISYVDEQFHSFTIQDAKDSDVLATEYFIFIFKNIDNSNGVHYYCQYEISKHEDDNQFDIALPQSLMGRVGNSISHYSPATKEQRDLLFQKMREAGYEWNAEKKELKKIEQKSAWSEEDERIRHSLIIDLSNAQTDDEKVQNEINEEINWLKSLKDRVQPKQEWSKDDEVKINRIVACLENLNVADNDILLKDIDWLKSLKPQNKWKPSDEQMDELRKYSDNVVLRNLYYNLKKLKVE